MQLQLMPARKRSDWVRPPTVFAGDRFGRLVVVKEAEKRVRAKERAYLCRCNCGVFTRVSSSALKCGNTKSCGCLKREKVPHDFNRKHGHTKWDPVKRAIVTPTYSSWQAMQARCRPGHKRFAEWYADRGITVCQRWRGYDGFANFLADMGERPDGLTLDRIDVNGNYEPSNCRWATATEQARNKRPSSRLAQVAKLEERVEQQRREIECLKGAR